MSYIVLTVIMWGNGIVATATEVAPSLEVCEAIHAEEAETGYEKVPAYSAHALYHGPPQFVQTDCIAWHGPPIAAFNVKGS